MQLIAIIITAIIGIIYALGWWITFTIVFYRVDHRAGRGWWIIFGNILQALMFTIIPIASFPNAFDANATPLERNACRIHLLTVLGGVVVILLVNALL